MPDTIAVSGCLASMTHDEFADLVRSRGDQYSATVSRAVTVLVLGEEELPFAANARPSHKLQQARALQRSGHSIRIVSESEFLGREMAEAAGGVRRLYTLAEACRLLGISGRLLRGWICSGLIVPTTTEVGPAFDFRELSRARWLLHLLNSGVPGRRIERALAQVRQWSTSADELLQRLRQCPHRGGRLILDDAQGESLEPTGQRLLPFDEDDLGKTTSAAEEGIALPLRSECELDFLRALQLESEGELEAAARLYRSLLDREGLQPELCFNLANVLRAQGRIEAAIERYFQAAELDPEDPAIWNNLGCTLADAGRHREAIDALQRALHLDPDAVEVHYSLADVLDEAGDATRARSHWRRFLEAVPSGPYADYARRRLQDE